MDEKYVFHINYIKNRLLRANNVKPLKILLNCKIIKQPWYDDTNIIDFNFGTTIIKLTNH